MIVQARMNQIQPFEEISLSIYPHYTTAIRKNKIQRSESQIEPSLTGRMKKLLLLITLSLGLAGSTFAQSQESPEAIRLPQMQPKKWALCIGVSNYQSLGKLTYSTKDSITFAQTLKTELNFAEDSVFVMADRDGYETPTADNVNRKLDEILSKSSLDSGDLFIIYFSGHGTGLADGDYWLPNDATPANVAEKGISITDVLARLTKKKLRNVVLISDACRSGDKNPFGRSLITLSKKTNIGVLLGCAPGQKSYESPTLGQGAFTYFLNRAIKNKSAIDKSQGSMLLSKLGAIVGKNVEEFTRHDYGDNAQKPSIFAEKEQEVVLKSVAPEDGNLTELLSTYQKNVKDGVLSPQHVKDAMSDLAKIYCDNKQDEEALQILRSLQSFGNLDPVALYTYVLVAKRDGLSYELNSALQKNNLDIPDTVWDDLAAIHGSVQAVGRARFIKAIWTLYDSEYRAGLAPNFYALMQQADANQDQILLQERLKKDFPTNPTVQSFAEVIRVSQLDSKADIDSAFQKLTSSEKSQDYIEPSLRIIYASHFRRRDYGSAKAVVLLAREKFPESGYWQIRSMVVSTILGEANVVENAKQIIASTKDGYSIMSMITILGAKSLALEPEFQAAATRLKGNLQAETALWIINSANHLEQFSILPDSLEKLAKDRGRVFTLGYRELSDLLRKLAGTEYYNAKNFQRARRLMADDMSEHFDEIGQDPDQVLTLACLLNGTDESYRLANLYLAGQWVQLEERLISGQSEFLREVYLSLVNNGMYKYSDIVFERLIKSGGVNDMVIERRAMESLFARDLDRASKLIKQLDSMKPQGVDRSIFDLVSTHFAFMKGDKEAVKKYIDGIKPDLMVDEGVLLYIEYLKYLSSENDIPTERFLKMIIDTQPRFHDLWSISVKTIAGRCYGNSSSTAVAIVENLSAWSIAEPLNVNFQKFGFNQKEDLSLYVGHYEFDGYFTIKADAYNGTFVIDVDSAGNLKGTIEISGETENIKVKGKINGFGRGAYDILIGDKPNYGSFALIPHAKYLESTKETLPPMLLLMDTMLPYRMGFVITGPLKK